MPNTPGRRRQPKGVPVGGQFAEEPRKEPNLHLTPPAPEPIVYSFLARDYDRAQKAVQTANRRLERANVTARFELTQQGEAYTKIITNQNGQARSFTLIDATLNEPVIKAGNWEFIGRVDQTESGQPILIATPQTQFSGWEPEEFRCEHCNTNRHRGAVFVVRNSQGEIKQLGRNCLQVHTGMRTPEVGSLQSQMITELAVFQNGEPALGDADEDSWHQTLGAGREAPPVERVLAITAAQVEQTRGWKPQATADPTIRAVKNILTPVGKTSAEDEVRASAVIARANEIDTDQLKQQIRDILEGDESEWATNVLLLLDEEHVSHRHVGLLASALSAVAKHQTLRKPPAPGFIGEIAQKTAPTNGVVIGVRTFETMYGTSRVVRFQTESGHVATWFSSSNAAWDLEEGHEVVFSGIVKAHDNYKGEDQTLLTRTKVEILGTTMTYQAPTVQPKK